MFLRPILQENLCTKIDCTYVIYAAGKSMQFYLHMLMYRTETRLKIVSENDEKRIYPMVWTFPWYDTVI